MRRGRGPMRDIIKMTCGNCGRANYTTTKNKRTMSEKFEIKKFCPVCRKSFRHKEVKISKGCPASPRSAHPRSAQPRCCPRCHGGRAGRHDLLLWYKRACP